MSVFKSIRNTSLGKAASNLACQTPLYDWTLNSEDIPERLTIKPVDAWSGNAEKGKLICQGRFEYDGGTFALYGENFNPIGADPAALKHVHSFEWLRDLRTLGGQTARVQAMELTRSWMRQYDRWDAVAWDAEILSARLCMWLSHFDLLDGALEDEEFDDLFFAALMRQSRHLFRTHKTSDHHGLPALRIIKGLLYAGLSLNQQDWIAESLTALTKQLDLQINYDGGHISRAPDKLLAVLHILLDIRIALNAAGVPLPESVQQTIEQATPALKFFRYQDKQFALFAGTQKGNSNFIDTIIAQAGVRSKALTSLPITGYEKITHGRGTIFMDTGNHSEKTHKSVTAHASPLAFEFTYGKERFITNCGNHPTAADWQHALAQTPAYSTATLNDKSAKPTHTTTNRRDDKHTTIVEATHDGYVQANGLTHTRRLYLCDKGQDFRGEDSFTTDTQTNTPLTKPVDIAIRFHLHPDVQASLIQNGNEVLLKLRHGGGWRFTKSAGQLTIEDSIYLGEGTQPRKTKQLVIHGQTQSSAAHIQWALRKEG